MTHRWCLVVNPRSAGGATARRVGDLTATARAHFGTVDVRITERSGHATELTRQALADGFDRIVAVGGDGTANEVVNGMFDGRTPRNPAAAFGLLAAGTGGDLVKTLQVPRDPGAAFAAFARATPRPIDVLAIELRGHSGDTPVHRLGVNVVGFGMNGVVVQWANQTSKRWGGTLTFLGATLHAVRTYDPVPVQIEWKDESNETKRWSGRLSSAFVANGAFCGGGMWVGRGSAIDDGLADVTILPPLPLPRMIVGAPRLFTGTLEKVKEVSRVRVRSIVAFADSASDVPVDVDGEQPGFLPIRIDVLEKVLLSLS